MYPMMRCNMTSIDKREATRTEQDIYLQYDSRHARSAEIGYRLTTGGPGGGGGGRYDTDSSSVEGRPLLLLARILHNGQIRMNISTIGQVIVACRPEALSATEATRALRP